MLETSRFGKRIGEARWVMQKEALVGYYQELLDDPERIAAIYMSMKPDYIDGEVAGLLWSAARLKQAYSDAFERMIAPWRLAALEREGL